MSVFSDSLDLYLFRPDCNPYNSILARSKKELSFLLDRTSFFGPQHPFVWIPDIKGGEVQLM